MNSTRAAAASTHAVSPASNVTAGFARSTFNPPLSWEKPGGNLVAAGALLLYGIPRLARRHQHRVPDGSERRGVGGVEVQQLLDGELGGDGGGQNIDALGRPFLADDLGAEQLAAARLGEDLHAQGLGAGEVAGACRALDAAHDVPEA